MENIIVKNTISKLDYDALKALEKICVHHDDISLKLELDYKLKVTSSDDQNEFFYYENNKLIAYLGLSNFGGKDIEISGMVDPDHRRKGIFTKLFERAMLSCQNRHKRILLISDTKSLSGIGFIDSLKAKLYNKEHVMYLKKWLDKKDHAIDLVKACNDDAEEIYEQDKIYFGDLHDGEFKKDRVLPESEEEKGYTTYLAYQNHMVIGKVKLTVENSIGAIYGLGVKPAYRRRGLGRAILNQAIALLRQEDPDNIMLEVVSNNDKALDLYIESGFEVVSTMAYYVYSQ